MPQLIPFFYFPYHNFLLLIIIIYLFSKYILPRFIFLFKAIKTLKLNIPVIKSTLVKNYILKSTNTYLIYIGLLVSSTGAYEYSIFIDNSACIDYMTNLLNETFKSFIPEISNLEIPKFKESMNIDKPTILDITNSTEKTNIALNRLVDNAKTPKFYGYNTKLNLWNTPFYFLGLAVNSYRDFIHNNIEHIYSVIGGSVIVYFSSRASNFLGQSEETNVTGSNNNQQSTNNNQETNTTGNNNNQQSTNNNQQANVTGSNNNQQANITGSNNNQQANITGGNNNQQSINNNNNDEINLPDINLNFSFFDPERLMDTFNLPGTVPNYNLNLTVYLPPIALNIRSFGYQLRIPNMLSNYNELIWIMDELALAINRHINMYHLHAQAGTLEQHLNYYSNLKFYMYSSYTLLRFLEAIVASFDPTYQRKEFRPMPWEPMLHVSLLDITIRRRT